MSGETLNNNSDGGGNNEWDELAAMQNQQPESENFLDESSERLTKLSSANAHAMYDKSKIERYLNPEEEDSKYEENGEYVAKLIMERRAKDPELFKQDMLKYGPSRNSEANLAYLQDAKQNGTFEEEAKKTIDALQQKIDSYNKGIGQIQDEQKDLIDNKLGR